MAGRTFAVGDIHGELSHLQLILDRLPTLTEEDTLVFLGDYVDRGPHSAQVVRWMMDAPNHTPAKIVALRGNHEDSWLRVIDDGWDGFCMPPLNGCLAALRSFVGGPIPELGALPTAEELASLRRGKFFPPEVVSWMRQLPYWYEDEHAIYVHAGLPQSPFGFLHPKDVKNPLALLWCRNQEFFRDYRGKRVIFGHTRTELLPPELSDYTPEDPTDMWAGENVVGLDTGCGNGGFLTALELPSLQVYESRN